MGVKYKLAVALVAGVALRALQFKHFTPKPNQKASLSSIKRHH